MGLKLIGALLAIPAITAVLLALIPNRPIRSGIVRTSALVLSLVAIFAAWTLKGPDVKLYKFEAHWVEILATWGGVAVAGVMLFFCRRIKASEAWIPVTIVVSEALVLWAEFTSPMAVERPLMFDNLTGIMAVIIGLVGGLICVYALGYMRDYQEHHHEMKDKRQSFFFTLFLFLTAMMGIVVSNNLGWLFLFWEVTTLCSFLLIGYSGTEEATRNAYRALGLNALGGLGFALALLYLAKLAPTPTWELSVLMQGGQAWILIPAALLAFAGLAKSAQFPFSSWLLGAMVAPTPVSALLHSSTMVKAGVYLILRFGKPFAGTAAGQFLALTGGLTFLVASLLAVTQSNAKRVLAYSTIANLGLIVACAGVGTPEALWAGALLVVFHAVSKALLFLSVGTIEHKIESRDIEDMEGMLVTKPFLAVVILTGIVGMFLAPFGMLISKWACMQAFVEASPALAALLAFGSAPTLLYYAKWMGKLIAVPSGKRPAEYQTHWEEKVALALLALMTAAACALFPLLGHYFVDPWLTGWVGHSVSLSWANITIMMVMLGFMGLLPLSLFYKPKGIILAPRYLAGINREGDTAFTNSLGAPTKVGLRNYYLTEVLDEAWLTRTGVVAAICLIAGMLWMVR